MIGWIALATAMAAEAPTVTVDDVLITAVSPRPAFSGVLRTFVILDVRIGGSADRLFEPYIHADQFVPAVGQRCTVTFKNERFDVSLTDRSARNVTHKIVRELRCGNGRFSMDIDGRPSPARR